MQNVSMGNPADMKSAGFLSELAVECFPKTLFEIDVNYAAASVGMRGYFNGTTSGQNG